MPRREPYLLTNTSPTLIKSLDFVPRTISIVNTSRYACYVNIGGRSLPNSKSFTDIIPPLTSYVGDPVGATDFAVLIDNAASPLAPFDYPVVVTFSEGAASTQFPISSILIPDFGSNYDNDLVNIVGKNHVVTYLPLSDLTGLIATNPVDNLNWLYGASNVTLGQPGIGDGTTVALFGGAAAGQVVPPDPVAASMNSRWNVDEGTLFIWLFLTTANMASATIYYICIFGADGSNQYSVVKTAANTIQGQGHRNSSMLVGLTYTGNSWLPVAITWNKTNNRFRVYANGAQVGADQALVGTPSGSLTAAFCQLASQNNANYAPAYLSKFLVADRELSPLEMAAISAI